jgi:hypothetical protein
MSSVEVNNYLGDQWTCRLATGGADGPHVAPLRFLWHGEALWTMSLIRSQRWVDLQRDARAAAVVDDGEAYDQLRGVELRGRAVQVGEVPRVGEPNAELAVVEGLYAQKYGLDQVVHKGRHGWLKLMPDKITSWDFRKIPTD